MRTLSIIVLTATLLVASALSPALCFKIILAQSSDPYDSKRSKPSIQLLGVSDLTALREHAQGQVLVINFWATWCHGCVAEFPEFVALDEKYGTKGVKVVGISLDSAKDVDSKVRPFISKAKAMFDIRVPDMDDPQPIIDAVTTEWSGAMPATFIFDGKGKLAYHCFGVIDRERLFLETENALKRFGSEREGQ
jgi:thiol-disulfide isomerase/thioredoxin